MQRVNEIPRISKADEIPSHLNLIGADLRKSADDLGNRFVRTEASVAFTNIARRSAIEIERVGRYCGPVVCETEVVALCARNLFELNLFLRHIMSGSTYLKGWVGQCVTDRREAGEALAALTDDPRVKATIAAGVAGDAEILQKHGITAASRFNVKKLAEQYGLLSEYQALYKLFSKVVHPSSWLVNLDELTAPVFLDVFVVQCQIYALDTLNRIQRWDGNLAD